MSREKWIVSRVPKKRVPMEVQVILETVTEVDDRAFSYEAYVSKFRFL